MDPAAQTRQMVILTGGVPDSVSLKTADAMLRYCPEQVVALIDAKQAGKTTDDVLGIGGSTPFISSLEEVSDANHLLIGVAPPGGRYPESWRPTILAAIDRGWNIVSGLHQFLCDDEEFSRAAAAKGVELIDVRKNDERDVATFQPLRDECLRVLTVGNDCSLGKMVVAYELARALKQTGVDAKFAATGQTGIILEGDGCPVDCVVSDFLNGAVEKLVRTNEHHEVVLVEGQGSITHPRYSPVTLGLLHGSRPQAMILCYEVGRKMVRGLDHVPLKPLHEFKQLYEKLANVLHPSQVIGIAMNSRNVSAEQAEEERGKIREEFGLPVCDVVRHGPDELVQAIQDYRASHGLG